jgi:hypothetical protein
MKSLVTPDRPEKWTAGVDYFRWKVDRMHAVQKVRDRLEELQQRDRQRASSLKPWKFQGYNGWQTDSVRWGARGGLLLWESSGQVAASTMAFMEPSIGFALRIDLQTTLAYSSPLPHFATRLIGYSQATLSTSLRRQILAGLSTRTDGSQLGTVGRRTSPSYLRVYDKGVESSLAPKGTMWRVEVEAKGTHARKLCDSHLNSLTNPKFCANYVASSVTRLGLRWPCSGLADSPVDIRLGTREETTAGKLALWLSHSVAPTIPRLLTAFTVAEVLEMLKLSDVAAPIGKDDAHA